MSNSPRLGLQTESYAQIIISSNDDASGVLQLSPGSLTVTEGQEVPQLRVVRTGGTFGEVSQSGVHLQQLLACLLAYFVLAVMIKCLMSEKVHFGLLFLFFYLIIK